MDVTCVLGGVGGMFIVRTVVVYREVLLLRSPLQTNLPPVLWEVSERRKGGGETERRGGAISFS